MQSWSWPGTPRGNCVPDIPGSPDDVCLSPLRAETGKEKRLETTSAEISSALLTVFTAAKKKQSRCKRRSSNFQA